MKGKKNIIIILAVLLVLAFAFWDSIFIYPFKLFVVILHEMSHGLAAVMTGGRIVEISISPDVGGYCRYLTTGGFFSGIFVASAGYLGSTLAGCLLLFMALKWHMARYVNAFIALLLLGTTLFYVRQPFGIVFFLTVTIVLFLMSFKASQYINTIFTAFIGLISCFYSVVDIKEDLIMRTGIGSDADAIAAMLGVPALSIVIGLFWMALAAVAVYFTLKSIYHKDIKHLFQEKKAAGRAKTVS